MNAFKPTSIPDCECIVKTFEKAAIFSTDQRAVYAMTTPILSRIRSDASNSDTSLGIQFAFEANLSGDTDIKNAGMDKPAGKTEVSIETASLSQGYALEDEAQNNAGGNIPSAPSEDEDEKDALDKALEAAWPKGRKKHFMVDCVPCLDKIKNLTEGTKNFFDTDGMLGKWIEMMKQRLLSALDRIKSMLDMFANQGIGMMEGICDFFLSFNFPRCPSDLLVMIKGLSTLIAKWSFDLFGEFGLLMGLIGSLIPPLISAVVQLLKNIIQIIIAPINCIIDALVKVTEDSVSAFSEGTKLAQSMAEGGAGVGVRAKLPVPGRPDPKGADGGYEKRQVKAPTFKGNITYDHFKRIDKKRQELGTIADFAKKNLAIYDSEGKQTGSRGPTSQQLDQMKEIKKLDDEWEAHKLSRAMKKVDDASKFMKDIGGAVRNMSNEIVGFLREIAAYIDGFAKKWLVEWGRLIGESIVLDMGFLDKMNSKLTVLQMILLIRAMIKANWNCEDQNKDEETLASLINSVFSGNALTSGLGGAPLAAAGVGPGTGSGTGSGTGAGTAPFGNRKVVIRDPDGTIRVVSEIEAELVKEKEKIWKDLDIRPTSDPDFDSVISETKDLFTSPTEMVFSCNRNVSSAANAAQIENWIREL
jgi:hypothetical protein